MLSRAKHLLLFGCGGEKQILRGVYPERSRRAQDDPPRTLYTNTKNGLNLWFGPKPPTKSWQPWPAFVNELLTQDTRAIYGSSLELAPTNSFHRTSESRAETTCLVPGSRTVFRHIKI